MKKLKKILIIGDSNCIPLYLEKKDQNVPINEIYISKLKKKNSGFLLLRSYMGWNYYINVNQLFYKLL